jgi:ubiquitin carboxyl-terminal hydrolase L3
MECSQLLGMVPRPVRAVILLFPIEKNMDDKKKADDERIAQEGQPHLDNTIFWVKQTVCL